MTALREQLLTRLARGGLLSGADVASELGISRAAVGKQVSRLRALGWPIEARRGEGYRLPPECRPLTCTALEARLNASAERIESLEVLSAVDSTSRWLEEQAVPVSGRARLCIAEIQHEARGRRGRVWHAAPGQSITFSAARAFARTPVELASLGLAVGVAITVCLRRLGVAGIGLKWPNDLVCAGAKLGGILVDLRGEAAGRARATVGVGLNHVRPNAVTGQPVTAIADIAAAGIADRADLAGALMAATVEALEQFARDGFAPFQADWHAHDALFGRSVRAFTPKGEIDGIARGIAADGALRFECTDGRWQSLYSADVSIRPKP